MLETTIALMSQGASKVEVAAELGITRDTLYEWVGSNEEFSDTIKMGETLSQAWWEKKARLSLDGGQFNTALWFINMKNRFGWQNTPQTNNQGGEIAQVPFVVNLSPEYMTGGTRFRLPSTQKEY